MPGFWPPSLTGHRGKLCLRILLLAACDFGQCSFFSFLNFLVNTSEHSLACVHLHAHYAPDPVPGLLQRLAKQQAVLPVSTPGWVPHGRHWESPGHFLHLSEEQVGYLLLAFVILNVKPLGGFLVGFMCPCFYFQFIMNSVFGKCLLYFVHFLFFAITTVIVMLSWYKLCFIIIFLSRSATLASAFWKINCFLPSLFKVMHLHFSTPSRDKCWTTWQF